MNYFRQIGRAVIVFGVLAWNQSHAAEVIRIGDVNSYRAQAAYLTPYKQGMELAVDEINAAGGVDGRRLEVTYRDDGGNPGDAVKAAEDLVTRDKIDILSGGFLSNIGVALADFAKRKKIFFLASEPLTNKIVWEDGNAYTFRLRPSTYMQVAMLVPDALKMNKKRWALVYPNYEYGQSAINTFKALMKKAQPDIEFVTEQATPLGNIDAGAVAQAITDAKPDAIFNVLFGSDLAKFIREGDTRGLFRGKEVVSLLTGEPEYLDPLKDEAPQGWLVNGYPWYSIATPASQRFVAAYKKKYSEDPRMGSLGGYITIQAIAAGASKAGSVNTDALIRSFSGLSFATPVGNVTFRAQDHQSTLGTYIGRIALQGGRGVMVDYHYLDGANFQPSDAEVQKLRPASN